MTYSTNQDVLIDYTNWKGDRRMRRIRPIGIAYCANRWHPKAQWMIEALDLEDPAPKQVKFFPLASIHSWSSET
jgi:hypothetical protein